jgi:hypothetical protein
MWSPKNGADRLKQPNPTLFQRLALHPPTRNEFSGLAYLDEGYPKLREGAVANKIVIVRRILADRRIAIVKRK